MSAKFDNSFATISHAAFKFNADCPTQNKVLIEFSNGDVLLLTGYEIRRSTNLEFDQFCKENMMDQAKYIGKRLQELRLERGLGVEEVAELAGMDWRELRAIENGSCDDWFDPVQKVLLVLGCRMSNLAR